MGLGSKIKNHNYDEGDTADVGGGGVDSCDGGEAFGSVSCSICLETVVTDNSDRSWAKLKCGHQFHLDCIGSAFNAKGVMQCPNCRKIEKGQWLYANGCRSFPEFGLEDWVHDEELYDLGYSEMSFGIHWCPFGSLARLPSFEDGEFSSSSYNDILGQHGFFLEPPPPPASSAAHPCPYVAYFGPVHPSSSNSTANVSDTSNFNNHWNGETPSPYGFPAMDQHYHNWEYNSLSSSRMGSANQQTIPHVARSSRTSTDIPRAPSFAHSFPVGNSSSARAGTSVTSGSMIPPYPGSNARTRGRVQALQAYYQQSQTQSHPIDSPAISRPSIISNSRRSNRGINNPRVGSVASSSDQTSGFTRFNIWERDHHLHHSFSPNQVDRELSWGPFHHASTDGSASFHQRHGS